MITKSYEITIDAEYINSEKFTAYLENCVRSASFAGILIANATRMNIKEADVDDGR
jgi:hypothetical protein